jgi:hypothetical protein
MRKDEPYHFVRFLWAARVDLIDMEKELSEYVIGWRFPPETESKMHLHLYNLRELKLKADTLNVFISLTRAVLFQLDRAPFTAKDMELRKRIFRLYPRNRPTPFPFLVHDEPLFEVQEAVSD